MLLLTVTPYLSPMRNRRTPLVSISDIEVLMGAYSREVAVM